MTDHAELATLIRTPICLDESIGQRARRPPTRSRSAPARSSTSSRAGSAATSRRAGCTTCAWPTASPVWCGGMLETGLGRAANVALAALPGFTLPGDMSASDRFYAEDITAPFTPGRGHVAVPHGPGPRRRGDPRGARPFTVSSEWIRDVT